MFTFTTHNESTVVKFANQKAVPSRHSTATISIINSTASQYSKVLSNFWQLQRMYGRVGFFQLLPTFSFVVKRASMSFCIAVLGA